jgi:hypothetical protein
MKEIEPNPQTPEQLLQILDAQLAAQRARRKKPERNRVMFLVASLLFIMVAAAAALTMLEEMLVNSPRDGSRASQAGAVSSRKFSELSR